jgi:hypothetical protein
MNKNEIAIELNGNRNDLWKKVFIKRHNIFSLRTNGSTAVREEAEQTKSNGRKSFKSSLQASLLYKNTKF